MPGTVLGFVNVISVEVPEQIVVVPLAETDFQAGVTTILEGMAMGKAVIATRTSGQVDVIEDRRAKPRWSWTAGPRSLVRELAEGDGRPSEPTGFYVPPAEPRALRDAIAYLMDHPDERARLGRAGRRAVERYFTLELFVARVGAILGRVVEDGARAGARSAGREPGTP